MTHALALGRRGMGHVWPNPAVGCVIVQSGRVVGRGWTAKGGRPHAETQALAQAGPLARGATAYVTLEPCAHHGKTPPCAEALVSAGISRVVVASDDPDERVAGRGIAILEAAGIDVCRGVMQDQSDLDHAGFLLRVTQNRPFVTLKLACSLDGRIATASGESKWITGALARRHVHAMRATHDAVMVGAGTVRADDPSLTVRDMGVADQPVRVIVSRKLDLPRQSKLVQTAQDSPVWVLHGGEDKSGRAENWTKAGATCFETPVSNGRISMIGALNTLANQGITRVYCEGGGTLAASLLQADLVDQLVVYNAGLMIGAEGMPALAAMGIDALAQAPRLELSGVTRLGNDIEHIWRRANR